jgi:hypothetical protein
MFVILLILILLILLLLLLILFLIKRNYTYTYITYSGQTYDEEEARNWSLNISDSIRQQIYEKMSKTRYKVVVQTTVGQQSDQAIRVASRCLWDPSVDNYASATYSNETIFCNVLVFCLYTD